MHEVSPEAPEANQTAEEQPTPLEQAENLDLHPESVPTAVSPPKRWLWPAVGGLLLVITLVSAWLFFRPAADSSAEILADVPRRSDQLKLEIRESGVYTLSSADVAAFGWSVENWQNVALTSLGEPVPFVVQEGQLLFYGQASDDMYTEMRPYLLTLDVEGTRMAELAATAGPLNTPTETVTRVTQLGADQIYMSNARSKGADDLWFWHTLHVSQKFETDLDLPELGDGSGVLTVNLWGASSDANVENDHDFDLLVNGRLLETVRWDGEVTHTAEIQLPSGTLQPGTNQITFDNQVEGATLIDIMQLNWVALRYAALPVATADWLDFEATTGALELRGFSGTPLVIDIANPAEPRVLRGWEMEGGRARLSVEQEMHIVAAGPQSWRTPARIVPVRQPTILAQNQQADLLILTTDSLAPALEPLIAQREAEGLSVSLVPVEEIYDTFGDGLASPEVIQEFLRYAASEWEAPAPQYLLLVGDATYDFRDNLGERPSNHVPSLIVPVVYSGETVSDARLADLDGDMKPDLAVGRWPVDSLAAVENLVARTLAYETGAVSQRALFTADGTSSEFTNLSDVLLEHSSLQNTETLYGATFDEVTSSWNEGAWLVNYVGHGSLELWGKEKLLTNEALSDLSATPTTPPIVLQFTCLTGFFAHPTVDSISEEMLLHEHGPVVLIAATSLTLSVEQRPFAENMLTYLQDPEYTRIGDVLQAAKAPLDVSIPGVREVSDTFGLLGDPTAHVVRPPS